MNKESIIKMLRFLGVKRCYHNSDHWVTCSCPLSKRTHADRKDRHPSFGILISDERSVYKCFSCTPDAKQLDDLIYKMWRINGKYPIKAAKMVADDLSNQVSIDDDTDFELPEIRDKWVKSESILKKFPVEALDKFPLLMGRETLRVRKVIEYLKSRGIDEQVIYDYGVRYSKMRSGVSVFPFTDIHGEIKVLRCRVNETKEIFSVNHRVAKVAGIEFPTLNDTGAWFGLHKVDHSKPVLIVEGEIDLLRLATLGFSNVIACGGTSFSDSQLANIPGNHVFLGLDNDKPGHNAAEKMFRKLDGLYSVWFVDWGIVGKKDPGELESEKQLQKCLNKLRSKI